MWCALGAILLLLVPSLAAREHRGTQLIAIENFAGFRQEKTNSGVILTSAPITPEIEWNELVPSWNYRDAEGVLSLEIAVLYPDRQTKWYSFGQWCAHPGEHLLRQSVKGQRDMDGVVATDTLKMKRAGGAVQVRISLTKPDLSALKLLTLAFSDTELATDDLPPNKRVWGKVLQVKERSQASYPEGISSWCSPTSVSMLLSFWSAQLGRRDLDHDVPEVAAGVNDPNWPGTGNWPFNMAFASTHPGMRAYVSRFSDISELEDWIEAGIPVAVSVSYGLLRGKTERGNGHLVVCIGFTEEGNPVFNDPGRSQVRQIYKRADLARAWAESERTVYLVYPEGTKTPKDRYGHWISDAN